MDSGTNDHITGVFFFLSLPVPAIIAQSVCFADGSLSFVCHKGVMSLSPTIILSFVLHVLNFAYNLLSVSRLVKQFNCAVIFLPSSCLLQDVSSKRWFGKGYERDGLYYFGDPPYELSSYSSASF